MDESRMPVLVGVGQVTERDYDTESSSPLELMEQAVWRASDDAGIPRASLADLDTLAIVKSFREPTRNSAEALANRIGANHATQWMMPEGGNGPQYLVNRYSDAISKGECKFALFAGAEAMATGRMIHKSTGEQPAWDVPASKDPTYLIADEPMSTAHEQEHGIWAATGFYAMSENALRHHYGRSIDEHQKALGGLFSRFTEVAAASPHAWYPVQRSAEEIAIPSDSNRFVAWPYTKYMNAMNQINQSAALLLTSVENARRMGVSEDRFIYLHGTADTKEVGISERSNYYSSTALSVMAEEVFAGSALGIGDVSHIDFYSCFPVAVEVARDAFGIAEGDPRSLTVTGGLPFHGGAGNNYVMNSIATMAEKVRAD
ncbi:MAG: acetyl-CoA acetyltransferase, partial [Gammaproteobacteria bacterium]|nr:acetyl-CoA acetyltransferase [Gammaproteobacteria bacterium]